MLLCDTSVCASCGTRDGAEQRASSRMISPAAHDLVHWHTLGKRISVKASLQLQPHDVGGQRHLRAGQECLGRCGSAANDLTYHSGLLFSSSHSPTSALTGTARGGAPGGGAKCVRLSARAIYCQSGREWDSTEAPS